MFWIVRGRKTVKDVLRKCVTCKRFQGKCLPPPESPDLPDYRVNGLNNSYQATGLDFAGPLYIKNMFTKEINKVYILLLTCATSRALHLELTPDMKFPAFMRGFRRFVARRGTPELIVHDNFKTFKCKPFKEYLVSKGIKQKFILPATPWWGGFYERLVRSVKMSLKKVLGVGLLTFEELQTVLCEVEQVINSRPLVYVSEDDLTESITPFHLMFGRNITNVTNSTKMMELSEVNCSKRLRTLTNVLEHYWK